MTSALSSPSSWRSGRRFLLDKSSSSTRLLLTPPSSSAAAAPLHARSRHLQLPAAFSTSTSPLDDEEDEDESSATSASAAAFRKAVLARHSAKVFDATRPVPDETVAAILGLTLRSPTSFNVQPYTITIVESKEMKQRLAACMLGPNKNRVLQAPLTAVFAADLDPVQLVPRVQTMERQERGLPEAYLATLPFSVSFLAGKGHLAHAFKDLFTSAMSPLQPMPSVSTLEAWSFKNTAIAASWYMMACSAHGLDTCPMEGFDGRRIMQVLRIPSSRYAIPLVVSTGYELPAAAAAAAAAAAGKGGGGLKKSPRFPPEAVVFRDAYGKPFKGIPEL